MAPAERERLARGRRLADERRSGMNASPTARALLCVALLAAAASARAADCAASLRPGDDVQQAVDRVGSGGRVCLGPGEFRLRRFLAIRTDGVTLRGAGRATVLRLDDGVESAVVVVGDHEHERPARPVSDVTIERLRIVGGGRAGSEHHPAHPYLTNSAVVVRGGRNVALRRLEVTACRSACLLTEHDTRDVAIERNRIEGSVWDGISFNRTARVRLVGNRIRGNGAAGITCEHLEDGVVERNVVRANGTHGIYLADSYRNRVVGNRFADNVLSGIFLTCAVRERTPPVLCWKDSMSEANVFERNAFVGNRVGFTVAADAASNCRPAGRRFEPNRSRADVFARNPPDEPYAAAYGRCLTFDE
jgi:parallel beta-helix repeat protein